MVLADVSNDLKDLLWRELVSYRITSMSLVVFVY